MARPILIVLGLAILGFALKMAVTPATWPKPTLRGWFQRQVPYGTSQQQVSQFLEARRFRTTWAVGQDSFSRSHGLQFSGGTHTVQALIGRYRQPWSLFLFETSTEAFFGFDENNRLVDIRVRKTTNGL